MEEGDVMPHDHCPPDRRGHTWRELPWIVAHKGGPTIRELLELRKCVRCGALGRINSQGVVFVVTTQEAKAP